MKVIIVMTYYNRPIQLKKTLESFVQSKHNNFEVVVVDDNSQEKIILDKYPFDITVLRTGKKNWVNGVPAYNMGFHYALSKKPDVIIIQNAECLHIGDVISRAAEVKNEEYISFGCFSLDEKTTFGNYDIRNLLLRNKRVVKHDGDLGWYNHPRYRNAGYHWCAAITAENLIKLNGFDERFSYGYAYEDNYFLHQINCLGLKMVITEIPFVVHQWHYNMTFPVNLKELIEANEKLFKELSKEQKYKAEHSITLDL